jgi:hypothetical protein
MRIFFHRDGVLDAEDVVKKGNKLKYFIFSLVFLFVFCSKRNTIIPDISQNDIVFIEPANLFFTNRYLFKEDSLFVETKDKREHNNYKISTKAFQIPPNIKIVLDSLKNSMVLIDSVSLLNTSVFDGYYLSIQYRNHHINCLNCFIHNYEIPKTCISSILMCKTIFHYLLSLNFEHYRY